MPRGTQTEKTRALAQELSTYFKLLLLAIKGTPLLAVVTDWLEVTKNVEMLEKGQAGPPLFFLMQQENENINKI